MMSNKGVIVNKCKACAYSRPTEDGRDNILCYVDELTYSEEDVCDEFIEVTFNSDVLHWSGKK